MPDDVKVSLGIDYNTRKLELAHEALSATLLRKAGITSMLGKAILERYGDDPVEAAKQYIADLTQASRRE